MFIYWSIYINTRLIWNNDPELQIMVLIYQCSIKNVGDTYISDYRLSFAILLISYL